MVTEGITAPPKGYDRVDVGGGGERAWVEKSIERVLVGWIRWGNGFIGVLTGRGGFTYDRRGAAQPLRDLAQRHRLSGMLQGRAHNVHEGGQLR